jgi:hypothetical protein
MNFQVNVYRRIALAQQVNCFAKTDKEKSFVDLFLPHAAFDHLVLE